MSYLNIGNVKNVVIGFLHHDGTTVVTKLHNVHINISSTAAAENTIHVTYKIEGYPLNESR